MVSDDQAALVSSSWGGSGEPEATSSLAKAYEQIFLQGAAQGQSFVFSTGDNGDEQAHSGLASPDFPAVDPYVTAVGGTSTAIGASGTLDWQTGWGTNRWALSSSGTSWTAAGFIYGAGGGASTSFDQPAYQYGVVDSSMRSIPDVAMNADPNTGMLVGLTQQFSSGTRYGEYRVGGTSLAAPLFAGMTALTVQNAGRRLGLLNPTLYAQVGEGTFTDVTGTPPDAGTVRSDFANGADSSSGYLYSVRTYNQDSSLAIAPGWDDVTGIGVPNRNWLTAVPSNS